MNKYELEYRGCPKKYLKKIIYADSQNEALYQYHFSNGVVLGTFEEFMQLPLYDRQNLTTCKFIDKL